jgi:hypothetical protein
MIEFWLIFVVEFFVVVMFYLYAIKNKNLSTLIISKIVVQYYQNNNWIINV